MKPTLENSFSNLGNEKLIWWGAELDLETRIAIMQIAEVFFLPSLVEGLSISLLEAMSTGTECVATDAGADHTFYFFHKKVSKYFHQLRLELLLVFL